MQARRHAELVRPHPEHAQCGVPRELCVPCLSATQPADADARHAVFLILHSRTRIGYRDDARTRKTMPYERWLELSPHGQHVARFVHCKPGEVPLQLRDKDNGLSKKKASPKL